MRNQYLTMPQAAARAAELGYDMSAQTLKEAAYNHRMKAEKVGGGRRGFWLTTEVDLREYLEGYRPRPSTRKEEQ